MAPREAAPEAALPAAINATALVIEVPLGPSCPITRRTRPFSLARDDTVDPTWRDRAHGEHTELLHRMQHEFKNDKGIDYTPPVAEPGTSLYWRLHGVVACHFNRAEEASRSYREALQLAPESLEAPSILHALGKVYLGQGKFDAADQVLQLAEEREERAGADWSADRSGQLAQLQMLRLHAAAQLPGAAASGDVAARMAALLCEQVVALSAIAGIGGWTHAGCGATMRGWAASFLARSSSARSRERFGRRKYALLDAVLPPELHRRFLQPWYRWLSRADETTTAAALPGYELRWLAKRQRWAARPAHPRPSAASDAPRRPPRSA